MAYKLAISKAGYNVLTETGPNNLIFSSDYNTLKYYSSGSLSLSVDYSDYYDSEVDGFGTTWYYHRKKNWVSHDLGYVPFFIVYVEKPSGAAGNAMCPYNSYDAGFWLYLQAFADGTDICIVSEQRNQSNSGTITFDFDYNIFKNSIGL